jgi:hypothetical protein
MHGCVFNADFQEKTSILKNLLIRARYLLAPLFAGAVVGRIVREPGVG